MNTNATTASAQAAHSPGRLYADSIAFLIEERPLLWYEKPEDYDNLRGGVFGNLAPRDTLECIFSKNLVDCFWEHRRMRRLLQTAINFAMPDAAGKLLAPGVTSFDVDRRRKAARQAESVAYGVEEEISGDDPSLQQQMERARLTHETIHLKAYYSQIDCVAHIRHECERIENRIHWLLKNFETRRATRAAMARSLVERELAQTVEYREAS